MSDTITYLHPKGSFCLEDHPIPTGREEFWRFTPTGKLADFFDGSAVTGGLDLSVEAEQLLHRGSGQVPGSVGRGCLNHLPLLGRGQGPRGSVLVPVDRPSALAASSPEASYLVIDGEVSEPIQITIEGDDDSRLTTSHLVIEAKAQSRATVLIRHLGRARHIGNVEILVGEGADVTIASIQEWERGSVHLGQHEALVSPGASYKHVAVTLGGEIVRLQNNVSYAGEGGAAELYGVYFANAGQHLEHRLFVDHNHPKGTSHVNYRGALQGRKARSVWVGDVLIRPEAVGIETYESSKNLILTDGCRADAVPNLEIETGDIVGAGHSASTGRFDDEQLFYLQSRGVDEREARRLVVRGFFTTILNRIGIPSVADTLMDRIDSELAWAENASARDLASSSSGEAVVPTSRQSAFDKEN